MAYNIIPATNLNSIRVRVQKGAGRAKQIYLQQLPAFYFSGVLKMERRT